MLCDSVTFLAAHRSARLLSVLLPSEKSEFTLPGLVRALGRGFVHVALRYRMDINSFCCAENKIDLEKHAAATFVGIAFHRK